MPFQQTISNIAELEALVGLPSELVIKKQLPALDEHMQEFVARAPLLFLGTVGKNGLCDVSPRGDLPAAARVLDAGRLVIAERPGNRRADSLRNIIETGRAGLLFLVPGIGETLRVNGRACIVRDEEVLAPMAIKGKQPVLGIGIDVEECYFQCAKALIRSKLWDNANNEACGPHFDLAQVLVDQTQMEGLEVESLKQLIDTAYKESLY
ncbi:MAG: MSMEG_1061 family FMN-dependent PPOX-type flavoprotein [Gemmataceae bacterium]